MVWCFLSKCAFCPPRKEHGHQENCRLWSIPLIIMTGLLIKRHFLLYLEKYTFYFVCARVHVHACLYVFRRACEKAVLQVPSNLFFETGFVIHPAWSLPNCLVWLASNHRGPTPHHLFLLQAYILHLDTHSQTCPIHELCTIKLRYSYLQDKHFTSWHHPWPLLVFAIKFSLNIVSQRISKTLPSPLPRLSLSCYWTLIILP